MKLRLLCLVLLISLQATPARGDVWTALTLADRKLPLLGGHILVRMPANAKLSSPSLFPDRTISGFPQDLTALDVEAGGKKLVLVAKDLFAVAGPDFEQSLQKGMPPLYRLEKRSLPGLPRAMTFIPALDRMDQHDDVLKLYVTENNDTVYEIRFFSEGATPQDLPGAAELANRIARTLTAGKLRPIGGVHRLPHGLSLTLPSGYVAAQDRLSSIHLFKLAPIGEKRQPDLSIDIEPQARPSASFDPLIDDVVDKAARAFATRFPPPKPGRPVSGKLFGKQIECDEQLSQSGWKIRTCKAAAPQDGAVQVTVTLYAKTVEMLAELQRITELLH